MYIYHTQQTEYEYQNKKMLLSKHLLIMQHIMVILHDKSYLVNRK